MCQLQLKAGYGERKITPPFGLNIPGYFNTRASDGIITDLYVRAVAFDNGKKRAVIFMCDTMYVHNDGCQAVFEEVSKACNVDIDCIYLHGTHSHTAVNLSGCGSKNSNTEIYMRWQHLQFRDAAVDAFQNLDNCSIKIAKGTAVGVGFMRRYEMKDGTFKTNPKLGDPNILKAAGEMDNSVQLIRIIRENEKEILLVNFGTHPDTLGGTKYFADWPGYVVDNLKKVFDQEVCVLMLNGCQGNSGSVNRMLPPKTPASPRSTQKAKRMARMITGEVLKIYDNASEVECNEIAGYKEIATVGHNPHTPEEEEVAKVVRQLYIAAGYNKNEETDRYAKECGMTVPKAMRIMRVLDHPEPFLIPVSGLKIGDLAFIGFPGEPFTEIGIQVKKNSNMAITFVTCCTNGSFGYFPTEDAFAGAGYERDTSAYSHDCAKILVDAANRITNKMEQ